MKPPKRMDMPPNAQTGNAEKSSGQCQMTPQVRSSDADATRLLHELQVHQVELETQNEDLRRAHAELETARAAYFDLYNLAPVGYCTLSGDGLILEGNLTIATMLGVARCDLVNQPMVRYIHREDRDLFHIRTKHLLETGEAQACELRLSAQNGTAFWGHITATMTPGHHGIPTIHMVLSDITVRRRAEDAVHHKNEEIHRYFNTSPDLLCIADGSGFLTKWNPAWEKMLGYTTSQLEERRFLDFVHPDDLEATRQAMATLEDRGASMDLVNQYLRQDGTYCWVEWRIHRVGDMVHAIGRDITEKRQLEERLHQREKMDAIGQLTGGIAHDFNNQLATIMMCSEKLADRLTDKELAHFAHLILSTAQTAANLTKQLLAFSHKGKFLSTPVDFHAVVAEVVALLEHGIDKCIAIRVSLGAESSTVLGDPAQLQNALLNLALNARDAMPHGGELAFTTSVVDLKEGAFGSDLKSGRYLEACISDTGCGMDAEVKRHLFEPFFTTKDPGKGTGLGLASAFGTIKNHMGTMTVNSESGKGTTFRIYMPLIADMIPDMQSHPPVTPAQVSGLSILVVEDEKHLLEITTEILKSAGFSVIGFNSGEKALAYYAEAFLRVDLVVLDMVMPLMGGRQVFQAMKKTNPAVKAILTSGYGINGEAQAILDDGVVGFVQKPYRMDLLLSTIAKALG